MLTAPSKISSQTAPLVVGLVVLALGAIAMALPPAPITTTEGSEQLGILQSSGLFSSDMAEQNASNDFGYLAVDVSSAELDADSLWRRELDVVARRRYTVWGWIDTRRAGDNEAAMMQSLGLEGYYLYGPDAVARAKTLRVANPQAKVIPVLPASAMRPEGGEYAVTVDLKTWLASDGEIDRPVLLAAQLSEADVVKAVEHARDIASEDGSKPTLLIARIAITK
ncbi:MAG: hypothetical protein ACYTGZ_22060 [Planctomycetota bacterium]|jgi:hypothetical protein